MGEPMLSEMIDAAEHGDAEAQFRLGLFCYKGKGSVVDMVEGVKWFRKAAEQGHAEAQYALGLCYEKGTGVSADQMEAAKWFRKAAEQGQSIEQPCLATN